MLGPVPCNPSANGVDTGVTECSGGSVSNDCRLWPRAAALRTGAIGWTSRRSVRALPGGFVVGDADIPVSGARQAAQGVAQTVPRRVEGRQAR